jgi:hypothetical protein
MDSLLNKCMELSQFLRLKDKKIWLYAQINTGMIYFYELVVM